MDWRKKVIFSPMSNKCSTASRDGIHNWMSLHAIGSKLIRAQTLTNYHCVYTGPDGFEPIRICYPHPNGITFESDLIGIRSHPFTRDFFGTESKWDRFRKWSHLGTNSRSKRARIRQAPCKRKAYSLKFGYGSIWIPSRVNGAWMLIWSVRP